MSDAKFTEWLEAFTESDEYKADSFHWSQMARAAYDQGWHDGDEFQLDCHQDHEKYKLERLRDQFAMHILPSIMLRWKEPGYTESGAVAEAYSIANTMIECRVI